jgi:hypothetical protein
MCPDWTHNLLFCDLRAIHIFFLAGLRPRLGLEHFQALKKVLRLLPKTVKLTLALNEIPPTLT